MPVYVDPRRRGLIATVALGFYAAAQLVEMATTALTNAQEATGIAALFLLVAMIAALSATLVWVYRVNANAHVWAADLEITPGWNVGWFFVPIANLWKPFQGIKDSWQASCDAGNWPAVPVPGLFRAWWGCWLVGNMLSNASGWQPRLPDPISTEIELVAHALLVAAALLLMGITNKFSQTQAQAARTFT